jgi:hypothetical protein
LELLQQQLAEWRKQALALLSQPLIPDLAGLVVDYLDGGGRPFQQEREKEEEKEGEAQQAAAAQ